MQTGADVDLEALPVLKCWPLDAGRFITLPLVFTKHPVSGRRNVGMYRLQVYGRATTGMHWHVHKDAAEHYRVAGGSSAAAPSAGPDAAPAGGVPGRNPASGRFNPVQQVEVALHERPADHGQRSAWRKRNCA